MSSRVAILIVPPAADMIQVEHVRRRFDPLVDAVPAHVTLVFPFEAPISDQALRHHVEAVAADAIPFDLELEGVTCSWNHYLCLNVGHGADHIRDLHRRLYTGPLQRLLTDQVFTPHVTVGRFATAKDCASALPLLDAVSLRVRTTARGLRVYDLERPPYRVRFEISSG